MVCGDEAELLGEFFLAFGGLVFEYGLVVVLVGGGVVDEGEVDG